MSEYSVDVSGETEEEKLCSVFSSLKEMLIREISKFGLGESESDIKLLIGSLLLFNMKDAQELFGEHKDVDERAMVGCVYRYMYCARIMNVCNSTQPHIDIEYDRMRIDARKFGPKTFQTCSSPKDTCTDEQKSKCNKVVSRGKWCRLCNQCVKHVRPDLIIHFRNSDLGCGNGMIVEFKRNKDDDLDNAKITYATCDRGTLRYTLGAVVKLSCNEQIVTFFKDSCMSISFKVYSDRFVTKLES
jgi:hypothetical protein